MGIPGIRRIFRAQVFGAPGRSGGRTLVEDSSHVLKVDAETAAIKSITRDHQRVAYVRHETTADGKLVESLFMGCWVWDGAKVSRRAYP